MLYSDIYATMALVAEHTKRIRIATGIVVPSNRIAPVTAHSVATINQMAPGRVILGIGTGFTGRNMMGLPPVPLASLREHVNMCRALLNGEEVLYREGKRERWIRLMDPAGGYINIKDPIPIIIAAQGPKALELAGEVGDGWVAPSSDLPSFQQNLATVRGSAQRAHKPVDDFSATMFCAACVLRPGEPLTSPRVLQWVGPIAAMALHALWESSAVASQLPPCPPECGKPRTPANFAGLSRECRRSLPACWREGDLNPRAPSDCGLLKTPRVRPIILRSFSETAHREFIRHQFDTFQT
jgi:5,10-methylenetetrahydromethanopterin reductase